MYCLSRNISKFLQQHKYDQKDFNTMSMCDTVNKSNNLTEIIYNSHTRVMMLQLVQAGEGGLANRCCCSVDSASCHEMSTKYLLGSTVLPPGTVPEENTSDHWKCATVTGYSLRI